MGRPAGRSPKPLEEKRRLGNPGKRPLPDQSKLLVLPQATETPEPKRPLGPVGRELWDSVWTHGVTWLSKHTDAETLLIVCEQLDERQALRLKVLRGGDWRDRAGLRALDGQVMAGLSLLGFNPVDRSRLGVAEVTRVSKLDSLRRGGSAQG